MKVKLMGSLVASALLGGLVAAPPVLAAGNIMYEYATVIDAEPIVKTVRVTTPREECWEENVVYRGSYERGGNDAVGTVLGGVVGGAIGNAVGHKKSNKQVGAVVGAVLGATLGNAISQNAHASRPAGRDEYGVEEVCRVVNDYHEEERIMGYNVRYRYNNETFSTRMNRDPGDTIKIRLAVSPVI